jgi:O-antigen/teichoic acid export membrane protein
VLKIVSLTVVRQIVSGLLQVANLVIVARFLTVPEMGQYTLAILLPTLLAPMLTLGIQSANIYGIGRKLMWVSRSYFYIFSAQRFFPAYRMNC